MNSEANESIHDAFLRSLDLFSDFIDRVAVCGWSSVYISEYVSIGPSEAAVGDIFQIGTVSAVAERSPIKLDADSLTWGSDNEVATQMAHLFRIAVSSASYEERMLNLYASLERFAEDETTERVERKCKECGHTEDIGPATGNLIRETLMKFGVGKMDTEGFRRLRGKVAHGSGNRTASFIDDLTHAIAGMEGHVLSLTAERLGATIRRPNNVVAGQPLSVHWFRRVNDTSFQIEQSEWRRPIAFPSASRCVEMAEGHRVLAGVQTGADNTPILSDILAWPELKTAKEPS